MRERLNAEDVLDRLVACGFRELPNPSSCYRAVYFDPWAVPPKRRGRVPKDRPPKPDVVRAIRDATLMEIDGGLSPWLDERSAVIGWKLQ